jgi:hypothetical protein
MNAIYYRLMCCDVQWWINAFQEWICKQPGKSLSPDTVERRLADVRKAMLCYGLDALTDPVKLSLTHTPDGSPWAKNVKTAVSLWHNFLQDAAVERKRRRVDGSQETSTGS